MPLTLELFCQISNAQGIHAKCIRDIYIDRTCCFQCIRSETELRLRNIFTYLAAMDIVVRRLAFKAEFFEAGNIFSEKTYLIRNGQAIRAICLRARLTPIKQTPTSDCVFVAIVTIVVRTFMKIFRSDTTTIRVHTNGALRARNKLSSVTANLTEILIRKSGFGLLFWCGFRLFRFTPYTWFSALEIVVVHC